VEKQQKNKKKNTKKNKLIILIKDAYKTFRKTGHVKDNNKKNILKLVLMAYSKLFYSSRMY